MAATDAGNDVTDQRSSRRPRKAGGSAARVTLHEPIYKWSIVEPQEASQGTDGSPNLRLVADSGDSAAVA
jgi:hypothetical protein